MATGSVSPQIPLPEDLVDYESLITEDDIPVDSVYAERQHQLLTMSLLDSWEGPRKGEPRYIATDVGLFYSAEEPAYSPDVMISLGVAPPQENPLAKRNRSYFIWLYKKPPDLNLEVVSNRVGGELTTKLHGYARIGVPIYVVWDPETLLSDKTLHCFALEGDKYAPCEPWFPALELGVKVWEGVFGEMHGTFLRWCDRDGNIIPTGAERAAIEQQLAKQERQRAKLERQRAKHEKQRADQEQQRAEQEKQRAEQEKQRADQEQQRAEEEKQRADKLAERLRSLGVDPEQL